MIPNFNNKSFMETYGLFGSNMTAFNSKAGAMSFAIMMSSSLGEDGTRNVNYDEAKKLFDFITENVALPDVEKDSYSEMLGALTGVVAANAAHTTAE
ncbi:MAG: hypothetical protein II240_00385 [Bacteroidaceae bacterium]|nr:hypothetical protein [Bacteroidaceae bacterium]